MIEKILIANRGEIAMRVIRTCRRLGLRTVAVYSDADADALFVASADEAYRIGGPEAADSYLRADRILDAAERSGAQAVHPGFGFLSENADFAETVEKAGLVFIGPPASAMRAMASKKTAKELMAKAGVPVVPGYEGDEQDAATLAKKAGEIGYPVLIKAVMGGGGKGMRRVDDPKEFADALEGAQREAKASFGDAKVLLEKYVLKPRHVEMQIFADSMGHAVHLFERDCSVQRRHQKVIEEAPAPGMTPELRERMGEAAITAAQAVGYVNAGTVEFLTDPDGNFYFLEMNTRLQVEHPVTEMITGQDLVEWQIRVAEGRPLPLTQSQLAVSGHAIEARVYAEDPRKDFLPATGDLRVYRPPTPSAHVRIDTGVREGDRIDVFYDPMIAKLIVWDTDRDAALRRLRIALAEYRVAGVTTNLPFLSALAAHPAVRAGGVDTGFLAAHRDELIPTTEPASATVLALAALYQMLTSTQQARKLAAAGGDPYSPWHLTTGWRMNTHYEYTLRFLDWGREAAVTVRFAQDHYEIDCEGECRQVSGEFNAEGELVADLSGVRVTATVVRHGSEITLITGGSPHRLLVQEALAVEDEDVAAGDRVKAPMPGSIVRVMVEQGQTVERGDALMVLEAMKMEHTIKATAKGVVMAVHFAAGDQVDEESVLLDIEAGDGGESADGDERGNG
ncbi:MAG: acetyl/propionyl/methylcrotonyl-CoA carboxylase subunit alpha [Deltaproteobacteria bacterium]|nr:acetyl/propionyl/methylcrotonyl-CoA carboxylase subunit alpha [Deltaproteobacteria bacterium]MCB9487382.1 acetyl/propionyl/methylcrotonyl-CoA carboxylase subunit alpha [Deltaproteobacteria bacterium]